MKPYAQLSAAEQKAELAKLQQEYNAMAALGLNLNMSRGKPCPSQLDLSMDMLQLAPGALIHTRKGTDVRNYGELAGVDEAKELFADLIGVDADQVIMGGQSSLCLMYDTVVRAMLLGVAPGCTPWGQQKNIKFLCPVPGYDRHFAICEQLGIQMISIPMNAEGPDMDLVEEYVNNDPSVKGIWCVPKYSNPSGITYSKKTVERFASLKPAANDFRIFWDNAYLIHDLTDTPDELYNIFDACKAAGTQNMVYAFFSTSKVSFSGSGVAVLASGKENIAHILKQMGVQTIGYDKINQLRHVKFFQSPDGLRAHMKKHAALLAPKFALLLDWLEKEIAPLEIGSWHKPNGGYFIGFVGLPGTAKRCVQLCKEAGVVLTGAGATHPYGVDPDDATIRIAPSYPTLEELDACAKLFCLCQKIAALEALLQS